MPLEALFLKIVALIKSWELNCSLKDLREQTAQIFIQKQKINPISHRWCCGTVQKPLGYVLYYHFSMSSLNKHNWRLSAIKTFIEVSRQLLSLMNNYFFPLLRSPSIFARSPNETVAEPRWAGFAYGKKKKHA